MPPTFLEITTLLSAVDTPGLPALEAQGIDFIAYLLDFGLDAKTIVWLLRGNNVGTVPSVDIRFNGKLVARLAVHSILWDRAQWDEVYGFTVDEVNQLRSYYRVDPRGATVEIVRQLTPLYTDLGVVATPGGDLDAAARMSSVGDAMDNVFVDYAHLCDMMRRTRELSAPHEFIVDRVVVAGKEEHACVLADGLYAAGETAHIAMRAARLTVLGKSDEECVLKCLRYVAMDGRIKTGPDIPSVVLTANANASGEPPTPVTTLERLRSSRFAVFRENPARQWLDALEGRLTEVAASVLPWPGGR